MTVIVSDYIDLSIKSFVLMEAGVEDKRMELDMKKDYELLVDISLGSDRFQGVGGDNNYEVVFSLVGADSTELVISNPFGATQQSAMSKNVISDTTDDLSATGELDRLVIMPAEGSAFCDQDHVQLKVKVIIAAGHTDPDSLNDAFITDIELHCPGGGFNVCVVFRNCVYLMIWKPVFPLF